MADLVRQLVDHVTAGTKLDLAAGEPADEAAMRRWGPERTIPAEAIRDVLQGRLAEHPDPRGLRLRGARVTGRLDLDRVTTSVPLELSACLLTEGITASGAEMPVLRLNGSFLEHPDLPALAADQLNAALLSLEHIRATAASARGAVRLAGARVDGTLSLLGAKLRNDSGPALFAAGLETGGGMLLGDGFEATGRGQDGVVTLSDAHIGGFLSWPGGTLRNDSGPAVFAARLETGGGVLLGDGFEATGSGKQGAVNLYRARVGGMLSFRGAKLRNDSGPALAAAGLETGESLFLDGGFEATARSEVGALQLADARIGEILFCPGGTLRNDAGPALEAWRLQVGEDVLLDNGFEATGAGERGAVRLTGARVGKLVSFGKAKLRNDSGPALAAGGLETGDDVFLGDGFEATGGGSDATVVLSRARVGGSLAFAPTRLEHRLQRTHRLRANGLTYTELACEGGWRGWLRLLREATPAYAAQPYQQLALIHRDAGHDRDAQTVLVHQRRDQLHRAATGRGERAWGGFTGLALGYGYQPWRALLGLLGVVLTAMLLATLPPGADDALRPTRSADSTSGQDSTSRPLCPVIDRIGVALDRSLPLIKTDASSRCETTDTPAGQTLTAAGWGLQALAWAFATLFIAGFTSAVRKT